MNTKIKLYSGEHKSGKTNTLLDFYLEAVKNGAGSSGIIVITRNKTLEQQLKNLILEKTDKPLEQLNIFRFPAFVNRVISHNWSYLYRYPPVILGFSEAITAMRYFLKLNPDLLEEAYPGNLFLIKLFERQQRRVENCLSFSDLQFRTESLEHNETALKANVFLEAFHNWLTVRDRPLFDYSAQLDCFMKLTEISEVRSSLVANYNYAWLVDDIDEAIPAEQKFYEKLWGSVENFIYTGNPFGGVRQFMGSDPDYLYDLEEKAGEIIQLKIEQNYREKSLYALGLSFYKILSDPANEYETTGIDGSCQLLSSVSYSRMLEQLSNTFSELAKKNIKPEEITIVCWNINELLQLEIEARLKETGWKLDTVKGSQVLTKNPLVNVLITLLRIIFFEEIKEDRKIIPLTAFDFSQLLYITGNIDNYYLAKLRGYLKNNPENWLKFIGDYAKKEGFKTVKALDQALQSCRAQKNRLSSASEYREMILYLWKNLLWESNYFKERKGFNELKIFLDMLEKNIELGAYLPGRKPILEFIGHLLNGELSDNPDRAIDLQPGKVKLLTMQRLAEIRHSTPIQIWLDITADRWLKNDHHPVVNPDLLSHRWPPGKQWSLIEEDEISEKRLAKILRLSLSLCREKAYFLCSDYNIMGEMQTYDFIKSFLKG